MSRTVRTRLWAAAVLSWGVWAGVAAAAEPPLATPVYPPGPANNAPGYPPGPPSGYGPGNAPGHPPVPAWNPPGPPPAGNGHPTRLPPVAGPGYYPRTPPGANELPPGYPPVDNSPSKTPIRDWYHQGRPLGCWASFNNYTCSSLPSTLSFIFGSCRTFYGEPCLKGAPPSALPPWAGPESGYHGHPLKNEAGREHQPMLDRLRRAGCPNCQ